VNAWKAILAALVIFAAGTITGALISRKTQSIGTAESRPAVSNPAMPGLRQRLDFLRRLDKPLKLNEQQRERIEQILARSQERMKVLWQEVSPRMQTELEQTRDSVRRELSADQQTKFDEILRMRDQRRPEGPNHRDSRRERPRDKDPNALPKAVPETATNTIEPANPAAR
jgi:hypothetical protein